MQKDFLSGQLMSQNLGHILSGQEILSICVISCGSHDMTHILRITHHGQYILYVQNILPTIEYLVHTYITSYVPTSWYI